MRQGGDDRRRESRLRDHHSARRKQKRKRAQRPRARQYEVKSETDDDRGQTKERIREQDQQSATGEPADRQCSPARQADNGSKCRGRKADRQGKPDDARKFSRPERDPDITHQTNISTVDPYSPGVFAVRAAGMYR